MRSLKISYSEPFNLHGCLLKVGDFTVTYSVATPWTNPPIVSITRTVRVTDLDECSINSLEANILCPELLPKCDFASGAKCKNMNGSYTCRCPRYTHGDGFLPISNFEKDSEGNFIVAPTDYTGGTGCIDNKKPTITLKGQNPLTIVTCRHEALTGVYPETNTKLSTIYGDKIAEHSRNLEIELQNLIEASNGNELCSENISSNPGNPNECFHASDITHNGLVNLSDEVVIGNPVAVSGAINTWEVPYNVKDAAGNWADTVFRTVTIEEVSVRELEKRFSDQYASKMEDKIASAIDDYDRQHSNAGRQRSNRKKEKELNKCPECAVCEVCQENIDCNQHCEATPQNESNAECVKQFIPGNSFSLDIMEVLQISPTFFMIICGVVFIATIVIARLRQATSLPQPSFVSEIENQLERSMREPINQYSPQPTPQQNSLRGQRYTTSPFFSPSINNGTSYPSSTPQENRPQITESDIYSFPSPRNRSDDRTSNRWG